MSEANVELFREVLRCAEAEDADRFADLLHPEIRSTAVRGWPEPGPFLGRDAVLAQFKRNVADWEDNRATDIDVVADEGDWVVAEYPTATSTNTSSPSGLPQTPTSTADTL